MSLCVAEKAGTVLLCEVFHTLASQQHQVSFACPVPQPALHKVAAAPHLQECSLQPYSIQGLNSAFKLMLYYLYLQIIKRTCRSTFCQNVQSHLCCMCRVLSMARSGSVAELTAFLGKVDPNYAQYAPVLWQKGIKTPQQLAGFSEPHYLACGMPEVHIDGVKARADPTGELAACETLCKPACCLKWMNTSV